MMTDTTDDSAMGYEYDDKSVPTALDQQNISNMDDAANQVEVEALHDSAK
ncbi:unnamed protein product, partial [Rotaria sp. Silwood1]